MRGGRGEKGRWRRGRRKGKGNKDGKGDNDGKGEMGKGEMGKGTRIGRGREGEKGWGIRKG